MLREHEEDMPRLYAVSRDFNPSNPLYNPSHYFPSAYYGRHWNSSSPEWQYDLDKDFPAQCHIHVDELERDSNEFWIELRKDVERRYSGDCFYDYYHMDYRRWWNSSAKSEYNREYDRQKHGYWTFYFEEASDQTMFILKHSELISPKRYRFHPIAGVSCEDDRYDVPDEEEIPGAWRV